MFIEIKKSGLVLQVLINILYIINEYKVTYLYKYIYEAVWFNKSIVYLSMILHLAFLYFLYKLFLFQNIAKQFWFSLFWFSNIGIKEISNKFPYILVLKSQAKLSIIGCITINMLLVVTNFFEDRVREIAEF